MSWSFVQRSPTDLCVVVCDLDTSWMRRAWPTWGRHAKNTKQNYIYVRLVIFMSCSKNPWYYHQILASKQYGGFNGKRTGLKECPLYRRVEGGGKGVVSFKSSFLFTLPINLPVLCSGSKKLTGADRDCCNWSDLTPTATGLILHALQQVWSCMDCNRSDFTSAVTDLILHRL